MRPSRLLVPAALATVLAGCAGAPVATTFSEVGESLVELPLDCETAIADFLMEIEPVVRTVDFETATEEELASLGAAMEPAGEALDPELCPDLDVEQSRAAWLAIAAEHAPGTSGYIEYTYASD